MPNNTVKIVKRCRRGKRIWRMNSISEGSTPIGVAKPCCRVAGSSSTYGGSPFGTLATHPVGANVVSVNDDEAERKQRRLSGNMCNFLSPGCHTPRSTNTNDRYIIHK